MAHIWRVTLSVLSLQLVACRAQAAPSNVDCTGVPAGTRMWGCKAYHECREDGSSAYVECGWGMVYNELSRKCEHASSVDTPCGRSYRLECRDYGPPFGKIAVKDYTDPQTGLPCQYFFTCANGHFYGTQKCEGFQVFNEILQYCVKPESAPASCNPFGPQVANVEIVRRHWWKSDAAGSKSKSVNRPWWKAKSTGDDVAKAVVKQKHWLTRSAAARNAKNRYPKFEKMSVKSKAKAQEIAHSRQKVASSKRKTKHSRKEFVRPSFKTLPPVQKTVSTEGNTVWNRIKNISSEKTSLPVTLTTITGEANRTVMSSTGRPTTLSPEAEHPWNAKEKDSSSRSIVPKNKSHSSSTS